MKKIIAKILFIAGMMMFSAVAYGKDVFANYGTNFGKVRLSQLSSQNAEDVKRVDASTYELTGSGEYRIIEEGGRRLVVNLNNGTLNGKYDEYYANGNRFTLGNYVNGKKEGEWTVYTENGKVWKNINTKMISWMDVILHIMPKQALKKQLEIIQMAKCQELGLNIMKMVQENHKEITQMDKKWIVYRMEYKRR